MDDLFKKLYDYIEPFDADWKNRLKPAPKELIMRFLEVSKIKEYVERIPLSYIQFLERMGQNDGGLISGILFGGGDIDLNRLIRMIENYYHKFLDAGMLPFFIETIGGAEVFFNLSTENNKKIWWRDGDEILRISESFEKLMFRCAFNNFIEYEFVTYDSIDEGTLDSMEKERNIEKRELYKQMIQAVERYGITEAWFSESDYYIGEGKNIAFYMEYDDFSKKYYDGISYKILSKDPAMIKCIEKALWNCIF